MKRILRSAVSLLLCAAVALGGTACGQSKLPTTITIWTYYNGDQLECFNQLVEQFNSTVGKEKNIRVESSSQGSVNDLETSVLAAAEGKVGAEKLPNIVSSYADTAFTLDQMGLAVDLSPYLTEKEKSAYIAGFLEEGDLMNNGELKVFPIAKSTELLYLNVTDFVPFAEATGVTYADLSTVEGLNEAAHKYYDWTDAQTAAPNDGKALYGRDALTNYLLCGAQELGTTIFDAENGVMTLRFDKPTLRKLWDNYYVPYIKGWCSASGKFRSDDIKIGSLLAYVGSSSSASFFPTQVLTSDTESHGIEMAALPCPSFAGCEPVAVQQGAGMVVIPGTEDEISACVAFLKWFTQPENNLQFSVQSGYMPVTYAANSISALENSGLTVSESIRKVLSLSIFHDAQELTSLSDAINGLTQQLLDEGEISLSTLDSSSDAAYPLLEAAAPELISTLRIKSVTGVFLILNTHDLDKRKQDSLMPAIYLRDLDPDAAPSQRNADLTFVRAPAQLVQSLSIATDNSWSPTIRYRALGNRGFLYPPFQAAYKDGASLAASDYGHWTSQSYLVPGDTHEAIAYSQPLILPDGTVYGVIGVELLADYLWENLPCSELQNNGTYFLAVTDTEELSASELQLRPVLRSHCDGQPGSADESLTLRLHSAHTHRYLFSNALYIASVSPLNLYSRNAPFSGKHWLLVGSVPAVQLFAFAQRLKQLFSFIILITLAVGFVCSWLVSRRLARPVAKLSAEVAAAEADSSAIPHLSATGIRELDQFSSAFTQLSKDVLDSSTRFLRIMKLASAELGGYELRDDSVYVTDNFFSMLGLAQEQPDPLTPKAFRALMGTLEQRWFYRLSPANNKVFAIPQPDGSTHYITLRITHILGESVSEVGLAEDMTTTVLEQQRIEHERDYDTLTGLYRRRAFDRACEALFQQPEKLGCAALLMMDLDNLKQINDTYGHDWGDQYIRQTGQCFAANTPANTICSRLSGDEFLIFFYGYQDQAQLRTQLELLSAALQRSVSILPNGKQLHISISGGIAWYPTDGHDLLTLKKYADFAMYQVKHSHKGRMCDFDIGSYHQEAYAAQTQQDFERLLQEESVSYHFQPIYSARSGRVAAYEALMRVDLPTLHSPAQVMQLAHETGRLYEIERITVFHSSEIFQRMQVQGLLQSDALLFINSIANVSLTVEDVEEYAQRYPELLKRLVVEITEQEDLDRACLERKRNVPGFSGSFALDDYGSGYSNELNLLELSPRYIKIDISIVRGIDTDRDKQQIVSNIVAYAHARSMQLIAEGIETEAQLRTVIGLGVDLLQGYYLSRPAAVPAPIASEAQAVIDQLEHQRFNALGL